MNIDKLRILFEESKDKYGDARKMGTTYQSLYNIINKGSVCKVDLLERIAQFYNKPVGYFFDEDVVPNSEELIKLRTENDLLRELVGLRKKKEEVVKAVG